MRRSLSRFDVTCLGINAIIGSGIFALPDDLYRGLGGLSPLAFVICALGLLPVALCFAESASRTDKTGGSYVYAAEAFGPTVGFGVGWMCFANSLFSFAAVAGAAASNLARLAPSLGHPIALKITAVATLALFAALNYRGVKQGARAAELFTLCKISALLILIGAALPAVDATRLGASVHQGLPGVAEAVFLALFAVQGFEVVPIPAGETQNTRRAMPVAVVASLAISAAIYVVVQIVVVGAHPSLGVASETPLVDAALAVAPTLGLVVAVGAVLSTMGFVSGNALGTPRYTYAFASDGFLPRSLAAVHPRFATPHRAIVITCAAAAVFAVAFDYRALVGMSNVAVAVQYLATCLAVLVQRRRGAVAGFRAPLGPVVPLLGCAMSLWVFTAAAREELFWAAGALGAGLILTVVRRNP